MHMMVATAAQNEALAITLDEAKMLAVAVIDVGRQYAVNIDPRALAWVNLAGAGIAVYGPKAFTLLMQRKLQPRQPPQKPQSGAPDVGADITPRPMNFN